MEFVELLQSSDSEKLTVLADAEERHVLCEQPCDVECMHILGRAVLVRERQVHLQERLHVSRQGFVYPDDEFAHSGRLPPRTVRPDNTPKLPLDTKGHRAARVGEAGVMAGDRCGPVQRQGRHRIDAPVKLAPYLHRIGSDLVNSYLVEEAGRVTIIDAGLPGHWRDLQAELTQMGRSLEDVRAVVLTHGDTDHIGFAERIRRERGVGVQVHELDAARARGEIKKPNSGWGPIKIGPLVRFLWYTARRGGLRISPLGEVVTFGDGETLDVPGSPRVMHLPGHTPGSVAFHVPVVDAVFVGDAMTTGNVLTGALGPRPAPFTLEPKVALASLAKLGAVEATWVLPGHGAPWSGGVAEALRRCVESATPRP
jgi:glyoxylase-like metal-dependent hydrolase (beta-lactamase superfamily II)